jgi:signal peptidase II
VKKHLIIVSFVIFTLLLLDQIVKIYIKTSLSSDDQKFLIGNWFVLHYIENQGMAFGTTLGSGMWGKLALTLFRIVAIIGIVYYIIKEARRGASLEFLVVVGFICAGATGNLIDSLFYDLIFPFNPCEGFNQLEGSGIKMDCTDYGFTYPVEVRHRGFLFGNVVDMFQFNVEWPLWMPWLGGSQIFPAIWNVADACISLGLFTVLIRQKKYFPKETSESESV